MGWGTVSFIVESVWSVGDDSDLSQKKDVLGLRFEPVSIHSRLKKKEKKKAII